MGQTPVARIEELCRYIEGNLEGDLSLRALGKRAGLSPAHLQRVFKQATGLTPRQYADACRLETLKTRLQAKGTIVNAMLAAGYGSTSRLYERAPAQLGMTPTAYRRGGAALRMRRTTTACALGRLLLAATERGLCAVKLGDTDAELIADLVREFPTAQHDGDDPQLRAWADTVVAHLAGQLPHLDLPLDVQATAFQRRVWQELQAIPAGTTCSYREVAQRIERPSAVRAVARACAANPVALVVPCHRVVRSDGGLGGYRWGIERKRQLLEQEHARLRRDDPA